MAYDALNTSNEMLERMELDLAQRVRDVLSKESVNASVMGVFSIEDMEKLRESDVCAANAVAVGVGYQGATSRSAAGNVDNAVARTSFVDFAFGVILAVPAGEHCTMRVDATRVLTALRLGIMGTGPVDHHMNGRAQRSWEFIQEGPNIGESSADLLYYSQVWRLSLPLKTSQR